MLGGAAVTEEFHPGFRNSTASYTVSLLNPKVIRDLRLAEHGLDDHRRGRSPISCRCPTAGISRSAAESRRRRRKSRSIRARDAQQLPDYYAMLDRVAGVLRELVLATPPNIGRGIGAMLDAWKVAKRFRALDLAGQRDVLDLFTKSAGEVLDRWFESGPIKAAFGFDAVVGNYASPYTPGSAYVLLHHVFGEVNGQRGQWGHARGGMGAITQAMAAECAARGVTLRTGARGRARDRRRRERPRASSSRTARSFARAAWSRTSIRSSCSSSWSRPSICLRTSSRASTAIAADRARSG